MIGEDEFEGKKVLSMMKRQFNILKEGDVQTRKAAILEVQQLLQKYKVDMRYSDMEEILLEFSKILLQCFSDKSEKIRETSVAIYSELISRSSDISPYLRYVYEALVERLNCRDLEGVEGLDERLVPTPSQKPQQMRKLVEQSEPTRFGLLELAGVLVETIDEEAMRHHIDETIAILSALLMDPCSDVQLRACKLASDFLTRFKGLVFHFTTRIARAILNPLASKKSPIKIAAIQTLSDLLYCGTWKYTSDVFDILVGYKDPNYVQIREFYESSNNYNYFATLINHQNVNVREAFLRMVGDLLISLPDRTDVETRLIPYLLTGLFDPFPEIQVNYY